MAKTKRDQAVDAAVEDQPLSVTMGVIRMRIQHPWAMLFLISLLVAVAASCNYRQATTLSPHRPQFNRAKGFNGVVRAIVPAEDRTGDIYVSGPFTTYNKTEAHEIIRLNADGSVDSGFTSGTGFPSYSVHTLTLAGDGTGDIYVGGFFKTYNGVEANNIIRLNTDGSVDSSFAMGNEFNDTVYALSPAGDGTGDIYVRSYNGAGIPNIIRLNADGSVDPNFASGSGFDKFVSTLIPVGDGSGDIYAGGNFTTYNGAPANNIIRLNADGSADMNFASGSGFNTVVFFIVSAGDGTGDIYVGGEFTTYNGTGANHLIRLNANGSVDSGFVIGNGFNGHVERLVLAEDGTGDFYVGGEFTTYNGTMVNPIVRLHSNGSMDSGLKIGYGFSRGGLLHNIQALVPVRDGTGTFM